MGLHTCKNGAESWQNVTPAVHLSIQSKCFPLCVVLGSNKPAFLISHQFSFSINSRKLCLFSPLKPTLWDEMDVCSDIQVMILCNPRRSGLVRVQSGLGAAASSSLVLWWPSQTSHLPQPLLEIYVFLVPTVRVGFLFPPAFLITSTVSWVAESSEWGVRTLVSLRDNSASVAGRLSRSTDTFVERPRSESCGG